MNGAPASVQVKTKYIIKQYLSIISSNQQDIELSNHYHNDYTTIFGYSCRSLFYIFLQTLRNNNKLLKVVVSPIHHSSFIKIIEQFFNEDEIYYEIKNHRLCLLSLIYLGNNQCLFSISYLNDL